MNNEDLELEATKGNIVFNLQPQSDILVKGGHGTEKIMVTESGTTANRPTRNLVVGQQFFDVTLRKPIWLYTTSPAVWVGISNSNSS